MEANLAVRMVNITKTFSHVVANNNITLEIRRGEILSLLGENGSGKTRLNDKATEQPDAPSCGLSGTTIEPQPGADPGKP